MSHCIVSVGVGSWYPQGIDRLERSLIHHGWGGEMQLWRDEYPPGSPTHQEAPYAFKIAAIKHAMDAGHDQVLWLDTSAWAVGNPLPLFHRIETEGHYLWDGGYWCNEWSNDRSLSYFGVTREEARSMPMLYALIIGLDFRSDRTKEFFARWEKSLADGIFNGSWTRNPADLEAEEYLGHRHDQTCASLIAHQLGMGLDRGKDLCHLYQKEMPDSVVLTFQGM